MSSKKQNSTLETESFFSFLADSIERVDPDELMKEEYTNRLEARAEKVRELLVKEVLHFKQGVLNDVLVAYEKSKLTLEKSQWQLPNTPEARRLLLEKILSTQASHLTLQHREFRSLSDEDVTSLLRNLMALGAIS